MLLERIEPSLGRGERLRLDTAHGPMRVGRAEENDIRLYTDSASREHALIAGNELGEWVLIPAEGKGVEIDGEAVTDPVTLEAGLNLVMGRDHLRCVTEPLDRSQRAAPATALRDESLSGVARVGGFAWSWWLIGCVALVSLGLIAFAWFGR